MITDAQINIVQESLRNVNEDMFQTNKELNYSVNKYVFIPYPMDPAARAYKFLVETAHYKRVYCGERYLGIAVKGDKRFVGGQLRADYEDA